MLARSGKPRPRRARAPARPWFRRSRADSPQIPSPCSCTCIMIRKASPATCRRCPRGSRPRTPSSCSRRCAAARDRAGAGSLALLPLENVAVRRPPRGVSHCRARSLGHRRSILGGGVGPVNPDGGAHPRAESGEIQSARLAAISRPPRKATSVGMLRMPKRPASSGSDSVFTFASRARGSSCVAARSKAGAIVLHGPHQGAQKSTITADPSVPRARRKSRRSAPPGGVERAGTALAAERIAGEPG